MAIVCSLAAYDAGFSPRRSYLVAVATMIKTRSRRSRVELTLDCHDRLYFVCSHLAARMQLTASSIRTHGLIPWRIGANADQSQQEGQSHFSSRSMVREAIYLVPAWGEKSVESV